MSSRTEHCLDIVGRSIVYHCAAAALVVSAIVTVWGLSCLYSLLLLLESRLVNERAERAQLAELAHSIELSPQLAQLGLIG
jgi:hypothetical protein